MAASRLGRWARTVQVWASQFVKFWVLCARALITRDEQVSLPVDEDELAQRVVTFSELHRRDPDRAIDLLRETEDGEFRKLASSVVKIRDAHARMERAVRRTTFSCDVCGLTSDKEDIITFSFAIPPMRDGNDAYFGELPVVDTCARCEGVFTHLFRNPSGRSLVSEIRTPPGWSRFPNGVAMRDPTESERLELKTIPDTGKSTISSTLAEVGQQQRWVRESKGKIFLTAWGREVLGHSKAST